MQDSEHFINIKDHFTGSLNPPITLLENYPRVLAEAQSPRNMGRMENATAHGIVHGCCGDTMEFFLRIESNVIQDASFVTDGRESAIACASILTAMIKGLTVKEANEVTNQHIIDELGGLPPAKTHCAQLTANTLAKAINNWYASFTS